MTVQLLCKQRIGTVRATQNYKRGRGLTKLPIVILIARTISDLCMLRSHSFSDICRSYSLLITDYLCAQKHECKQIMNKTVV